MRKPLHLPAVFHLTVYLGCLDDEREGMWWVALDDLVLREPIGAAGARWWPSRLPRRNRVEMKRRFSGTR